MVVSDQFNWRVFVGADDDDDADDLTVKDTVFPCVSS